MARLEKNGDLAPTTMHNLYELFGGAEISSHPEKNCAQVQELLSKVENMVLELRPKHGRAAAEKSISLY